MPLLLTRNQDVTLIMELVGRGPVGDQSEPGPPTRVLYSCQAEAPGLSSQGLTGRCRVRGSPASSGATRAQGKEFKDGLTGQWRTQPEGDRAPVTQALGHAKIHSCTWTPHPTLLYPLTHNREPGQVGTPLRPMTLTDKDGTQTDTLVGQRDEQ